MCGIAGYISLPQSMDPGKLMSAACLMQHRGPDAEGFYFSHDNKVGLAHRRLSILDLSTAANQPMFTADDRYCIVFNGEIYNFIELKARLGEKAKKLKTTSDTEVIIELFARYGVEIFDWLNGMFSIAIYDKVKNVITIARDHVGIKPLFYYVMDDEIIFASELKVIKAIKGKELTLNKQAIPYYFHLGYIPEPLCIYNNVFKFPSASYWQIDVNSRHFNNVASNIKKFWRPSEKISAKPLADETEAKQVLKELLTDAVQRQLISDVPIGTFLSGGIDSSLVTAIASRLTSHRIKSFCMAIDDGKFNEARYAQAVAKHLGTEHHEFHVKEKRVLDLLDRFLIAYDEPYGDSSAFPTMMVSELAKEQVTVTLSGDGGDELFMGYSAYLWAQRLNNPLIPVLRWPLYAASKFMSSRLERAGRMFAYPAKEKLRSHIFSTEQYYFSEQETSRLLGRQAFDFSSINEVKATARELTAAESQSLWDLESYLKDDLLVKVDRASMQFSLETRVPILDKRIVEFSLNVHHSLKINKDRVLKYLLKEVLYDYVPKQIFERPKWGFRIPLENWMQTDLREMVEKYTATPVIKKYDLVNYHVVASLKKQYYAGKNYLYNRLWLVVVLHWWLEHNFA